MNSEKYLHRTLELARKGLGHTWPNPLVGAVIVKNDRVIGEGFHRAQGLDHAEVDALKNCSESPVGATVYVNLEPCCHTNKVTPPCAQRLIEEKIKKVVIVNLDPNPHVNGKGVELLKTHGIEVEHGLLREEGEQLNEVFFHAQRTKKPFVHLKLATTLDGKIALPSGESQWITGEKSRALVHELRSHHQAVIVGAQTVRADNPKLNVRIANYQGKQPWRIVFTEKGDLPKDALLFNDELKHQTLVYSKSTLNLKLPSENMIKIDSLTEAMDDLFTRKLMNLFLEGGPTLASTFMKEKLINRVSVFMNPSFLGAGKGALADFGLSSLSERPVLKQIESRWVGDDFYLTGRPY